MTKREAERQRMQWEALERLGLNETEIVTLRRASMQLQRWGELECNHDIQRDEKTGKVTIRESLNDGTIRGPRPIADRETPALKRCQAIADAHGLVFYHQGDPRGAAVYIGKAEALDGHSIDSAYSRLICVY